MSTQHVEATAAPLPSGRHGLSREYVLATQRARLVAAAIRVAGTDGYAAMTVSAVIARAGVSRKTFYELFADREACFLAALDDVLGQARAGAREASAEVGQPAVEEVWAERLRRMLGWGLAALAANPHAARVAFVEVLAAGPRAIERRDAALGELARLIEPGYKAAPARVKIPRLMPEAIAGALYEIARARVADGRVAQLPGLLPDLLYCALAPFLGPAVAAQLSSKKTPVPRRSG